MYMSCQLSTIPVSINFRPQSWRDNIKGAGKSSRSSGAANPPLSAVPTSTSKPFTFTETDEGTGDKGANPSVARKVSVVLQQKFRRLINPNQKDLNEHSSEIQEVDANRSETPGARSVAHGIDYGVITNQFKYV